MKARIFKRLEAIEQHCADELARAKKEAYLSTTVQVLAAFHFGGLRPEETSHIEAFERALGGENSAELMAAALTGTLPVEKIRRVAELYHRVWLKGCRSSQPYSDQAMEETIGRMAEQLPNKWKQWIAEIVEESFLNDERAAEVFAEVKDRFGVSL